MGSNRDWGVPGQTLTIPPFAGPNDPQLRIGEPPELLVTFYATAAIPSVLTGALIFQLDANRYWYQVSGYTAASLPMVAFGLVVGPLTTDVYEEYFTARVGTGNPVMIFGANAGGAGNRRPNLSIGGGAATDSASFELEEFSRADHRQNSRNHFEGYVSGGATMEWQMGSVPVADVGMGTGYVTTVAMTASGNFLPSTYPNCRMFRYRMVGAGGSGGGTAATAAAQAAAAAGGGSGEYVEGWIPQTFQVVAVVIGAGGPATAAGNTNGNAGTATTVTIGGVLQLSANPGGGGEGAASSAGNVATQGGAGGSGGTTGPLVTGSVVRIPGSTGGPGMQTGGIATMAGLGAGSLLGSWTRPSAANSGGAGITAANYGSGSSGAWAQASQAAFGAGAASDGVLYIDVFM